VLEDVNIKIEKGEIIVVLGPSGSGKTTLLHIIAGIIRQDSGDVYINDRSVNKMPPEKRPIGLVFQDQLLFPHLNVFENISFGLKFSRKSISKSVDEIVEKKLQLLDIENLKDRFPNTLSGGQKQKVALARTLATEPEVLLLDEPLNNLDTKNRESIRFELRHLLKKKLGITTLIVTHDQIEAISIADRVAILHSRKIQQIGRPDEIFFKPRTEFVAEFLGFENIYKGKITKVNLENRTFVVKINNLGLVALLDENFSREDPILVSIRPEDISILPKKNTLEKQNLITGIIDEMFFLGYTIRLKVTVGEIIFIVVVPRYVATELDLKHGKEICLDINPSVVNLIKRTFCECEG
jgi:ABC-type Fe3+/spermidine/putrescine transport system ATPase subunit